MPNELHVEALLRLTACGGPAGSRRRLLEQAEPADALAAGPSLWRACGLSPAQVTALQGRPPLMLATAERWAAAAGHHVLGWHDPDYPALLRHCPSPPPVLLVAGDPALLWRAGVAIVGTRRPTPAGRDNADAFSRRLASRGFVITSGLAAGIDTIAHRAVLDAGGATVAVLGSGPDVAYPRGNSALHAEIVATGAVVSEHLPGTGPLKEHFPSRNRIIAGLSLGTLVIEAAHRSGALITARLATESGREVMALPGSIHNPLARGCHRLLRDGAALVESVDEIPPLLAGAAAGLARALQERMGTPTSRSTAGPAPLARIDPATTAPAAPRVRHPATAHADRPSDHDHNTLWLALGHDPTDMDQLVARTGLTPAQLSSMLLPLELEGRVTAQHGRYFRNR